MGGIDRRIQNLERHLSEETTEPGRSETRTHLIAILDELSYLRQSCASGLRGGVPIVPANIPRRILGARYTHRQLLELAITRSVDAGSVPADRAHHYLECICAMIRKDLDDVVEE